MSNNAINNAMFKIFRQTAENNNRGQRPPMPTTPCPNCGLMMTLQPSPDGRTGTWHCVRCKFNQFVRLQ